MSLTDVMIITALAVIACLWGLWITRKVKSFKLDVKHDDYILLACRMTGHRERFLVKNIEGIKQFCNRFSKVSCYVFTDCTKTINFDGSLIDFFIDHIKDGNRSSTFNVSVAKKLVLSKRKFDY